ncbi:hypothetical protein FOA43_003545 [Brettanomyces nanus]|uniref:Cytosolic Fe-S cluster assembly factor NAR1 n=1 Tax=Eeniella nana TaxID=13502 RepID=A0A875S919_EENNA|nr:uncharacterized protein FOA43_003545 [Brettanomyces nanus]QPG76159.1 hypothetical protein FOA43_003545 [Brettanomyces nanus]
MSAILSADDLNDFITPGVACIKPTDEQNRGDRPNQELEIEIDGSGQPMEVTKEGNTTRLQKAQISLADCLACSGCITSAEEVLMAQHSHKEFLNALKEHKDDMIFVASISHQTRASLANALGISWEYVDKLLIKLFTERLGFAKIVGTGLGRKISLKQMSQSIIERKYGSEALNKPVLSSICPGWVMYVEKTHPFLLPYMDRTKSPQQITGLLLKRLTAAEYDIRPTQVYHLAIMPCFDKKLEAARPESDEQMDVDCVITPRELVQMLQEEEIDVDSLLLSVQNDADYCDVKVLYEHFAPKNWLGPTESWYNDEGSPSGGYAFHYLNEVVKYAVGNLGAKVESLEIRSVGGRNPDIYELELVNNDTGESIATSAVVNGFRNIQNMVRKIKKPSGESIGNVRGRMAHRKRRGDASNKKTANTVSIDPLKCDLIEVMACPNGCINGGGQISGPSDRYSAKQWIQKATDIYNSIPLSIEPDSAEMEQWITAWLEKFTVCNSRLLKTTFRKIEQPKDTATIALTSTW